MNRKRNGRLHGIMSVLILSLSLTMPGHAAMVQHSKGAARVAETERVRHTKPAPRVVETNRAQSGRPAARVEGKAGTRVERHPQANRSQPATVVENQGKDPRESQAKPARIPDVRTKGETRPKSGIRRSLPIIEGGRRGRPERTVPEGVTRDKYREAPRPEPLHHEEVKERVRGTLERFRRDVVKGDSRALSGMLSDKSRIKITIDSKGINDSFNRGQAQYILREYLSSSDHRNLSFSKFRISSSDDINAYGVGKLRMRDRNSGKIMDRTVFISMAREGEDWTIREIRITE